MNVVHVHEIVMTSDRGRSKSWLKMGKMDDWKSARNQGNQMNQIKIQHICEMKWRDEVNEIQEMKVNR